MSWLVVKELRLSEERRTTKKKDQVRLENLSDAPICVVSPNEAPPVHGPYSLALPEFRRVSRDKCRFQFARDSCQISTQAENIAVTGKEQPFKNGIFAILIGQVQAL